MLRVSRVASREFQPPDPTEPKVLSDCDTGIHQSGVSVTNPVNYSLHRAGIDLNKHLFQLDQQLVQDVRQCRR
jgi:hypothetical protein